MHELHQSKVHTVYHSWVSEVLTSHYNSMIKFSYRTRVGGRMLKELIPVAIYAGSAFPLAYQRHRRFTIQWIADAQIYAYADDVNALKSGLDLALSNVTEGARIAEEAYADDVHNAYQKHSDLNHLIQKGSAIISLLSTLQHCRTRFILITHVETYEISTTQLRYPLFLFTRCLQV